MQNDKEKFKKEFIARLIQFTVSIVRLARDLDKDYILQPIAKQVVRGASSIGANVVEAQAGSSKRDYIKFFEIALKSANETKYWLLVIQAQNEKPNDSVGALLKEATEIANIIGSSVLTLKGKR